MSQPTTYLKPFNRNRLNAGRLDDLIMAACDSAGLRIEKLDNRRNNCGLTPTRALAYALWRKGIKIRVSHAESTRVPRW